MACKERKRKILKLKPSLCMWMRFCQSLQENWIVLQSITTPFSWIMQKGRVPVAEIYISHKKVWSIGTSKLQFLCEVFKSSYEENNWKDQCLYSDREDGSRNEKASEESFENYDNNDDNSFVNNNPPVHKDKMTKTTYQHLLLWIPPTTHNLKKGQTRLRGERY